MLLPFCFTIDGFDCSFNGGSSFWTFSEGWRNAFNHRKAKCKRIQHPETQRKTLHYEIFPSTETVHALQQTTLVVKVMSSRGVLVSTKAIKCKISHRI